MLLVGLRVLLAGLCMLLAGLRALLVGARGWCCTLASLQRAHAHLCMNMGLANRWSGSIAAAAPGRQPPRTSSPAPPRPASAARTALAAVSGEKPCRGTDMPRRLGSAEGV